MLIDNSNAIQVPLNCTNNGREYTVFALPPIERTNLRQQ